MKVIKNGWVHDGLGHVEVRDLAMDHGVLVDPTEANADAEVIDATGMHVMPGFIDPISHWGVMGSSFEIRPSSDDNDEKSAVSTPELNVKYAFNGRGITKQQLPAFGITTVGVAPTDNNVFGGMIAAFDVCGVNPFSMLIKEQIGMKASVNDDVKKTFGARGTAPMTKMGIFSLLKEELRQAAAYDPNQESTKRDEKLAALKQVTDGKMPVFMTCNSVQEMMHVKELFEPYPTTVIFLHGYGVDASCEFLLDGKSGLIMTYPAAVRLENAGTDYAGIMELHKRGLPVSFAAATAGWSGREDLLWSAMEMVKQTKDAETVLTMMTHEAACLLGIDDTVGTLEIGKAANVVIWSHHPLQTFQARVSATYLRGELCYKEGDDWSCYL